MNLTEYSNIQNFIGGEFHQPLSGNYMDNIDPATGAVMGTIPASNEKDVAEAVKAAEIAFPAWSLTPPAKRFNILNKLADLIDENLEELALAETTDNGKPLWLTRTVDIPRASANFRFFASAAMHFASESHTMDGRAINYTVRQPLGIVGCISPWNLPLYLFTWKIAPALAAGNCVIAKPSEVTPVTAYLLAQLSIIAGLPNGVLNIVHGTGTITGEAIVKHPAIKAVSFTGSTKAGERIASLAAPMFKKLSLELGGKNPTIIFEDCNWEKMMQTTIQSSFSNQGQICLCGSRILLQDTIYEKFKTAFVEKVAALTVGDPLKENSKQGAIVSKTHFDKIMRGIDTAKQEGGKILVGGNAVAGKRRCEGGYFIQPTVIEGLGPDCETNKTEIFGPVVTLQKFSTGDEALQLANACDYGLAATIWTQNISTANNLSLKLQAGIIWVNTWMLRDLRTPFGGMKNSGLGREGGWEAMRFFTEAKNICIEL